MEKIISNSTLVKNFNEIFSIIDIYPKYKNPSKVEVKIYESRITGVSLTQHIEDTLNHCLTAIIFDISVISGHSLPKQDWMLKSLVKELEVYLLEFGYENLTIAEIILAFRLNCMCKLKYPSGSEVVHTEIFGEHISVDYISRVLNTYFSLRSIFDGQLKNVVNGY